MGGWIGLERGGYVYVCYCEWIGCLLIMWEFRSVGMFLSFFLPRTRVWGVVTLMSDDSVQRVGLLEDVADRSLTWCF